VLSSAESEEPLMLPMEAIELDVFRHRYRGETFWCGTLLGGCGGQLTTKLYMDRACHFAHHPDPDGLPHACGRRARGVNSADHLYDAVAELVQPSGSACRRRTARWCARRLAPGRSNGRQPRSLMG
jgi:hypothetical protein